MAIIDTAISKETRENKKEEFGKRGMWSPIQKTARRYHWGTQNSFVAALRESRLINDTNCFSDMQHTRRGERQGGRLFRIEKLRSRNVRGRQDAWWIEVGIHALHQWNVLEAPISTDIHKVAKNTRVWRVKGISSLI